MKKHMIIAVLALFALALYSPKAALAGAVSGSDTPAIIPLAPCATSPEQLLHLLKDTVKAVEQDEQGGKLAAKIYDGIVAGMGAEAAYEDVVASGHGTADGIHPVAQSYLAACRSIVLARADFLHHFSGPVDLFFYALEGLRRAPGEFQQAHREEIAGLVRRFNERMQPSDDGLIYIRPLMAAVCHVIRQYSVRPASPDDPKGRELQDQILEEAAFQVLELRLESSTRDSRCTT